MARRIFSRKRIGLAALLLVIITAGAWRLMSAQAGASVEVVSGEPLVAGPGLVEAAAAAPGKAPGTAAPGTAAANPGGLPRAALSSDFHNFGAIGARAVVRRDFLLLNRGDAPLRVERAYTTCGCTTAEISAAVIPPGKAARVTLTFDAAFHPTAGKTVRRGLILETNDPARPQVEIWVQAAVGE